MKFVFLLFVSLAIISCASAPIPTSETKMIPTSRIYESRLLSPTGTNSGLVVIKRDAPYFGLNCTNFIFVDGVKVAQIEPAERLELYLSKTEHVLAVSRLPACGGEIRETSVIPDPSTPKVFRVWVDPHGLLQFQRTAL